MNMKFDLTYLAILLLSAHLSNAFIIASHLSIRKNKQTDHIGKRSGDSYRVGTSFLFNSDSENEVIGFLKHTNKKEIDIESSTDIAAPWSIDVTSEEVQVVREELIQKFLRSGRTLQHAETEVDKFLGDRDRSYQFLEMRRYANAQAEDLRDPWTYIQLGGAFVIGLGGSILSKSFAAWKDANPDVCPQWHL